MWKEMLSAELQEYLSRCIPPRPEEMQNMEVYAERVDFPIIGPTAGYFCYQLARMIGATRIFELGSGYGYSTAWFAKAIMENGGGTVYHVVWDEELSRKAQEHLNRLGFDGIVHYHVSEAVKKLQETEGAFDLIFNDIDKRDYPDSLPIIKEKLRPGGVLIVDNIFWGGQVFDEKNHTFDTQGVREFTRLITSDHDWVVSLIPIRDGLIIAFKK